MSKTLERELVKAKKNLSGLVKDTRDAIGEAAAHGYKELGTRPGTQSLGTNLSLHIGVDRYFPRILIPSYTTKPTEAEPFVLEGTGISVVRTGIRTIRRQHYREGRVTFSLPIEDRRVRVEFNKPDEERQSPHTVSISDRGFAEYDSQAGYTYPTAPRDGYRSPGDLVDNYAFAHQGAIGATLFVADSLSQTHGIESDTRELARLQKAWSRQSSTEMHPNIAALRPRRGR